MSKWNDSTLIGLKSGRLMVVAQSPETNNRQERLWKCVCECGNEIVLNTYRIKSQHTKSCGCLYKETINKNLTGKRFGFLTVLESIGKRQDRVLWRCLCDCGTVIERYTSMLTRGQVKSCGCKRRIPTKLLPNGEAARNSIIRMYKNNATKRNHSFELSTEECTNLFKSNSYVS